MAVPSPMTSDISKQALRQHLRALRDAHVRRLGAAERAAQEAAAIARLIAVLGDGIWASYMAMGSENDPAGLVRQASPDQAITYPWFADRPPTILLRWGATIFTRGASGVGPRP